MGAARARIRRRQLAAVVLVVCAITPVFNILTGESSLRAVIQGAVDASLVSMLVGGYLLFVRDGELRLWFRRLGFWVDLALSSAIALELLRRFVDDLTEPVLEAEGEIYQYAGDEVVITWPIEAGLRDAHCVRCFFGIRATVARNANRYARDFGTVPRFRGGLHGGTVTGGELGDLRQQIVFVGDILNTAARLEEYAKRSSLDLVVSGALLERLAMPAGIIATRCGELVLRGKEARVAAYSLTGTPA